jgi:uncharacterized radical SAM superfamily protein
VARSIDVFRPGRGFPSVSVTGTECSLRCRHCAGRYLRGMRPARRPEDLVRLAKELDEEGATGLLLSGGSDASGKVPLGRYTDAICRVKECTSLKVNAHVGLTGRQELADLVAAGVDAFSVDVYGSDKVIRDTLGLRARSEDFFRVVEDLLDLRAPIVAPHVCIGLEPGGVSSEIGAVDRLSPLEPDKLVFIVFTPTKGTPYEANPRPSSDAIIEVLKAARSQLPSTRLLLGCMRPRRQREYEIAAVATGIDGIVMPSGETLKRIRSQGIDVNEKRTCCALG